MPHLIVQVAHAGIAATYSFGNHPQPHLVICGVANEQELKEEFERLKSLGVSVCSYTEPDFGYQMTSIASAPLKISERKPFRKYKLL